MLLCKYSEDYFEETLVVCHITLTTLAFEIIFEIVLNVLSVPYM